MLTESEGNVYIEAIMTIGCGRGKQPETQKVNICTYLTLEEGDHTHSEEGNLSNPSTFGSPCPAGGGNEGGGGGGALAEANTAARAAAAAAAAALWREPEEEAREGFFPTRKRRGEGSTTDMVVVVLKIFFL